MSTTNGGQGEAPQAPQLTVLAQYIKDFSFENPNAPQALMQGQQPQINIQINVSAKPMSDTDIEVALKLDGRAQNGETLLFGFELDFAGVFRVTNVPQESSERGRADRMSAPPVPLRARDRGDGSAQWGFPAAAARSGGFRCAVPAENGADAAAAGDGLSKAAMPAKAGHPASRFLSGFKCWIDRVRGRWRLNYSV